MRCNLRRGKKNTHQNDLVRFIKGSVKKEAFLRLPNRKWFFSPLVHALCRSANPGSPGPPLVINTPGHKFCNGC